MGSVRTLSTPWRTHLVCATFGAPSSRCCKGKSCTRQTHPLPASWWKRWSLQRKTKVELHLMGQEGRKGRRALPVSQEWDQSQVRKCRAGKSTTWRHTKVSPWPGNKKKPTTVQQEAWWPVVLIIVYFRNVTLPWWYECHCDDYVSETNSGQPASAVHNELVQEALLTPDADCLQVSVSGVNNPIYIPHRRGWRCYGAMRYPEGLASLFRVLSCVLWFRDNRGGSAGFSVRQRWK